MKNKILVISNMYPSKKYPHYGVFVKNSVGVLEKAGYHVKVISIHKQDYKFLKLIAYSAFYFRSIVFMLLGRYKMVYAHYASHTAVPILISRIFNKHMTVITNVHGNDVVAETPHDRKFFGVVRKLLDLSELVICPSRYYQEVLHRCFAVPIRKIVVYPSGGVNVDLFRNIDKNDALEKMGLDKSLKYFGYVSRIEKNKGWDLTLRAFYRIAKKHDDVRLIVVGDGNEIELYNALVDKLGLRSKIIKYNLMSQEKIVFIYNCLEGFVFPTYRKSESLGLVGLEAMACLTVTILPNKYGPSSYGKDKVNSLVFNSGDYLSLYNAMEYCLVEDCTAIKKAGRETAELYSDRNTRNILINAIKSL